MAELQQRLARIVSRLGCLSLCESSFPCKQAGSQMGADVSPACKTLSSASTEGLLVVLIGGRGHREVVRYESVHSHWSNSHKSKNGEC